MLNIRKKKDKSPIVFEEDVILEENPEHHKNDTIKAPGDQNKIFGMLNILRKLVGVKDLINLRLSLPTQLLDPISNLEYWGYMDHPSYFTKIPENDDPLERLLQTLRWWVVKDSKYTKNRVVKPFNSILGERFFCRWRVEREPHDSESSKSQSSSSSVSLTLPSNVEIDESEYIRVEYITEQISHHPPVSAFSYRCQEKGLEAVGLDHISAKFSGLSATVSSGSWTKGVFVNLSTRENEEYLCTHPTAQIVGWITANLKLICVGSLHVICPKTKLAAVLDFSEKNWYGKIRDVINGKVFRYNPEKHHVEKWTAKTVPDDVEILATISGQWAGQSYINYVGGAEGVLLVDMDNVTPSEKVIKDISEQTEFESRRVWKNIAENMIENNFGLATKLKVEIEEKQRERAVEREEAGKKFVPALFVDSFESGKPELLPDAPINL
ncbi:hypothetical protein BB559_002475 [Furculomyces boomerangus]|uniref:Oxysterol-binding protein n=1 Tax=Furculomyces boomerangus TaxID=61424 RepID=A0A2T9YUY2_9FUNG|nr:hypothetical protein BB559_002475 [Furculomyces boomerangus]